MSQGDKEELAAWQIAPLADLVRHLVGKCHLECREDMARLETLVELTVLGEAKPQRPFLEIRELIEKFCREMRAHLTLEEHQLFPRLLGLEPGEDLSGFQDLEALRKLLEGDHEAEASLLRSIRSLTGSLATPEEPDSQMGRIHACITILSQRLQKHLYLENQILFPRTR